MTGVMRARRRRGRGQSLVEFAIVCPIALVVVLGILSGSWLFFQNEAVADGARGGSRAAAIATSLYQQTGGTGPFCESGSPGTVAAAVQRAAPQLPVNQGTLCAPTGNTTHLQQTAAAGKASVTVDATPSLAAPTAVTVTVAYSAQGLAPPLTRTFTFTFASTQPILQP
ncbi:MAG TPA: TadE/TadG family type IV pilus assembly protein [Candidatus Dormibacteraeota bacterium]|jgi:Flp pilus assembly protein TadG|nr:TadE/TadG family type IV pilus assembly protein [Candidatus Dormibacteraeota bacterium]